jgi:hypothetical protein
MSDVERLLLEAAWRFGIAHRRLAAFSLQEQAELVDLFVRRRAARISDAVRAARVDPLMSAPAPNSPGVRQLIDIERGFARLLL